MKSYGLPSFSIDGQQYEEHDMNTARMLIQDPSTFQRNAKDILTGNQPKYTCRITAYSECNDTHLIIGSTNRTKMTLVVVGKENVCQISGDLCKTQIKLSIKTAGYSSETAVFNDDFHLLVDDFQYMDIQYQTCGNESLRFSLPLLCKCDCYS